MYFLLHRFLVKDFIKVVLLLVTIGQFGVVSANTCRINFTQNGLVNVNFLTLKAALTSTFGTSLWVDFPSAPVGSGMATLALTPAVNSCNGMDANFFPTTSKMRVKFRPVNPIAGNYAGADGLPGFVFRTAVDGVGVKISSAHGLSGSDLWVSQLSGAPNVAGSFIGARFPAVNMTIGLVKTAQRFNHVNKNGVQIPFNNVLIGHFVIVRNDGVEYSHTVPVRLDLPGNHLSATILIGTCDIAHFNSDASPNRNWVVTLPAVSTGDFSGPGSIAGAGITVPWNIHCAGSEQLRPNVTFSTAHIGVRVGTALPTAASVIGIQLQLNGTAINFNQPNNLAMDFDPGTEGTTGRYFLTATNTFVLPRWGYAGGTPGGNTLTFSYIQDRNVDASHPFIPGLISFPITMTTDYF